MEIQAILEEIFSHMQTEQFSDLHISSGIAPQIRNHHGEIESLRNTNGDFFPIFTKEDIQKIYEIILSSEDRAYFQENFELDTSYIDSHNIRYRVNCFTENNGPALAFRFIKKEIPALESLGFGNIVQELCKKSKGLILMTGPTGSGKSTNIAAMIEYINTNFKKHIITIEDPIEFVFENKLSMVHQREIGMHTKNFPQALKSCLREDPNIILVGEMRDPETIRAALTLAETGHLVFSTLHTNDAAQSIDRIVDVFPAGQQEQVRMQLAMSLVAVIAQRLLPMKDKNAMIPAREILLSNDAVRNLILNGNTHQLYSAIEIGQSEGMILMDQYISLLYKKGYISLEIAKSVIRDKDNISFLLEV